MADISQRITRKSLKAKRKAAVKTIRAQCKEKIRQINLEYSASGDKRKRKQQEQQKRHQLRSQKAAARLAYSERQSRPFTLGEDLLSSIANGIGAGLSIAAIVLLVIQAYYHAPRRALYVSTFAIFGSFLFMLHLMATLYHAIFPLGARKVFSALTHSTAYLFVGSLYTPLLLCASSGSLPLLVVLWVVLAALCALYCVFARRLYYASFFSYVFFAALLLVLTLAGTVALPSRSVTFLVCSSLVYALAAAFFLLRSFKWTHSIFHLLALGANVLLFFCLYNMV